MDAKRLKQVIKYGWKHAGEISAKEYGGKKRIWLFIDILSCYKRYRMWSNQYLSKDFHKLSKEDRTAIGAEFKQAGIIRDNWQKDFQENRRFLLKYTHRKYELTALREKRNRAYAQRYNAENNLFVEYGVELSRQHYLNGTVKIGKNVLLAKNVFIDYSGEIIIGDNVQLTNGVIIETHHHAFHTDPFKSRDVIIPTSLHICEGAVLGSRSVILSSCHYIGKHARVGAGAVITKDVPDYAVVVGVPGKVIKYMNDSEQNG